MRIYPAIDLYNGRCVRLYKGDYNNICDYGNPKDVALKLQENGATFIHLVDLDGATDGKIKNLEAIKEIRRSVDVKLELGGGIRSLAQIKELLDIGIDRVILGSNALNLGFVKDAIKLYGADKVIVGIDCKNYMVSTRGWLDTSNIDASSFAIQLKECGIKTIIFTDISHDGTLNGINLEQTKKILLDSGLNVIASGGASSMLDIEMVKNIGCSGIILGKSIYSGKIDLKKAIELFED